ncbi:MAG: 30S ribosomal protein S3 [Candidatus Amoebophilus sp.]
MGQKVNPNSLRIGYIKGWESNWFSSKKGYADKLIEDHKIRKYLGARMAKANLSKIVIERTLKRITITVHSSKPGIIIGKGGAEVERIKEELRKLTEKEVHVNILEIKRPELDAKLVGSSMAQQIQARISYKRVVKQALSATMRVGAQGIKIQVSGRLAGAEIARSEQFKEGRIPLHTLRADIDFAISEAQTVYGKIGIKVWIFKGEVYERPDLSSNATTATSSEPNKPSQKNSFRGRAKN